MFFYYQKLLAIVLFLSATCSLKAQDPNFRQFPLTYLLYNPAYAGFEGKHICKTQMMSGWNNTSQTYLLSYDTRLSDSSHSGLGMLILHDRTIDGIFTNSHLGGIYSYNFILNQDHSIRIGTEISLNKLSIDFEKLIFPDQLDPQNGVVSLTSEVHPRKSKYFFDTKIGTVYKFRNLLMTFSINHPIDPNTSLISTGKSYLPRKFTGTFEYKFHLTDNFIFSPSFIYHKQSIFSYHNLLFNFKILKNYHFGFMYDPDGIFVWLAGVDFLNYWSLFFSQEIVFSELAPFYPYFYEGGLKFRFSE